MKQILKDDMLFVGIALAIWVAVWSVMTTTMPLFAVDETRYLTVAWEMRDQHQWLLPTLNGEPYSHKPPLLFWLINIMWTVFGVGIWPARVVQLLATSGALFATYAAARTLFPDDRRTHTLAPLLLLANPLFMVYGSLIMFDMLMTVWVTLGVALLWRLSQTPSRHLWLLWGLLVGMGLITKGPVVLVYLGIPAVALPLWNRPVSNPRWYRGILMGIAVGAAVVLSWAIPAAITGGKEFAAMIFWKQSAGRMVEAFDHAEPAWFYLPVLAVFLLSFLFWPSVWRGIKTLRQPVTAEKLLLCWTGLVLLAFTAMSGKQPHYLLPLTPGFALLAARLIGQAPARWYDFLPRALPYLLLAGGLVYAPGYIRDNVHDPVSNIVRDGISHINVLWFKVTVAVIAVLFLATGLLRDARLQALGTVLSIAVLLGGVTLQGQAHVYKALDLRPFTAAIKGQRCFDHPIAYGPKYNGEMGFLARMDEPFRVFDKQNLRDWLARHPESCGILRHKTDKDIEGYLILYSMPFREDQRYSLIRAQQ